MLIWMKLPMFSTWSGSPVSCKFFSEAGVCKTYIAVCLGWLPCQICMWECAIVWYIWYCVRFFDTFDTVCNCLMILCAIVWWYCVRLFDTFDTVCDCLMIQCAIVWWYSVQLFDDTVCVLWGYCCACTVCIYSPQINCNPAYQLQLFEEAVYVMHTLCCIFLRQSALHILHTCH
jgi:hypothetical protein